MKATVTLNFSCLKRFNLQFFLFLYIGLISIIECDLVNETFNRGIYPSEIIPYQIHIPANQQSKSSPILADEITATLKNLKTGFLRIQRVCSCISNKVNTKLQIEKERQFLQSTPCSLLDLENTKICIIYLFIHMYNNNHFTKSVIYFLLVLSYFFKKKKKATHTLVMKISLHQIILFVTNH